MAPITAATQPSAFWKASAKADPTTVCTAAPPSASPAPAEPSPPSLSSSTPKNTTDTSPSPSAFPICCTVLISPDADPACSRGTSERIASVSGATIRPIPAPITTSGNAICQGSMPSPYRSDSHM